MHDTEHRTAPIEANSSGVILLRLRLPGMVRKLTWKGFLSSIAVPLASLLWFYCFVARVRISLGRWPKFGEELSAPLMCHDESIRRICALLAYSLYPAAGFALGCLCFRRWRHVSIYFVCYAAAVLASFLAMMLAPGPYLNWFFD